MKIMVFKPPKLLRGMLARIFGGKNKNDSRK